MTAQEFVAQLDSENQRRLSLLAPADTLKPEVEGDLNVLNLLKVALRNEIEATEIAARWLVTTDDVDVKLALARQVGDEAKHYRMIADRLRALGFDATSFDPLAKGYGPLFQYLDTLTTTVERVAAGQFTREAIAVVKNRQFIEFCDRAGDRETATMYRDVIEPDERYHHELGRTLAAPAGVDAGRAGGGDARRPADPGARRRASEEGARHRGHPPRAGLLKEPMGLDHALDDFRALVEGPEIDLGGAALAVARIEYPDLVAERSLARLDELAARSAAAEVGDRQRALERLCEFLFNEKGFRGNADDYYDPAQQLPQRRAGPPARHPDHALGAHHGGRPAGGPGDLRHRPARPLLRRGARRRRADPPRPVRRRPTGSSATEAEAIASRAVGRQVELTDAHFVPATKAQIVVRMLRNLQGIYLRREDWAKALAVIDRLLVVEADAPMHVRDRGTRARQARRAAPRRLGVGALPDEVPSGPRRRGVQGRAAADSPDAGRAKLTTKQLPAGPRPR